MKPARSPLLHASVDLLLLWACLFVTFHLWPADRPDLWMLLAPAVIRLLVGVSPGHSTRNNALVALASGLLFHFLWGRGFDVVGLGAWFLLGVAGRGLPRWLARKAAARARLGAALARGGGLARRGAATLGRKGLSIATASSARYWRGPLLCLAGLALTWPYLTRGVVGSGDAHWYTNAVADFTIQIRTGIFPVWAGQTPFSFMGGTFPVRLAPYLQHLAALIDLLTGRQLEPFALLNLVLVTSYLGGLCSAYLCLGAVLPRRPWTVAALALLYVTCPAVLGLGYAEDLYMSVTTLPFLPLVFLGIIRSFERDDVASRLLMAGGLAAAWLAHPPITMWCGLLTLATQIVRLWRHGWTRRSLGLDLLAAGVFAALAGYSFVSVASLGPRLLDGSDWRSELIEVRLGFPGNWLPLPRADRMENLQFGFGLAAVLLALLSGLSRRRSALAPLLAWSAAIILVMLVPVPLVTGLLWHLVPRALLRISKTWPMLRLPVVLVLCTVFGAALQGRVAAATRRRRRWEGAVLILALGWSGWEAYRLVSFASRHGESRATSVQTHHTENLLMTRAELGVAPANPRFFSNGVMDPALEGFLLGREPGQALRVSAADGIFPGLGPGPKPAVPDLPGLLSGKLDENPGVLNLLPSLVLQPGQKYLLALQFLQSDYAGILILRGPNLFREYALPSDGEPWAFGSGTENTHLIPLWTSLDRPETVDLKFVPAANAAPPLHFTPFARFALRSYTPDQLPIQVKSLLPYRAIVRSDAAAYLETPRLFVPGYRAHVDGVATPVAASADNTVIVPVEAGTHEVALDYVAPFSVQLAYWTTLGCWSIFLVVAGLMIRRSASAVSHPNAIRPRTECEGETHGVT